MTYHIATGVSVGMSQRKPSPAAGYATVEVNPASVSCGMVMDSGQWRHATPADNQAHERTKAVERHPSPFSFLFSEPDANDVFRISFEFHQQIGNRHGDMPTNPTRREADDCYKPLSSTGQLPATHRLSWIDNISDETIREMQDFKAAKGSAYGPMKSWEWEKHPAGTTREEFIASKGLKEIRA